MATPATLEPIESAQEQGRQTASDPAREIDDARQKVADPQSPTHDEIARLAYEKWEAGGRREASDLDNWFEAERSLRKDLAKG